MSASRILHQAVANTISSLWGGHGPGPSGHLTHKSSIEPLEHRTLLSSITLVGSPGADTFELRRNGDNVEVFVHDYLTQQLAASEPLTITVNGGGGNDALLIGTDVTLANDPSIDAGTNLAVTVNAGATLGIDTTAHLASLTIGTNAKAQMLTNGSRVLVTGALDVATDGSAWTGTLDLADNDLLVHNADPADVRALVKSGRNGGFVNRWRGAGIGSSTAAVSGALGYMKNDNGAGNPIYPLVDGQPAAATDVIVKWTYVGDTNLDGRVDVTDMGNFSSHYGTSSGARWQDGDYNYDGAVDVTDLGDLASNYGTSASQLGVTEGTNFILTVPAGGSDDGTIIKWVVAWGSGDPETFPSVDGQPSINLSHAFTQAGTYSVSFIAYLANGSTVRFPHQDVAVAVAPAAPVVIGNAGATPGTTYSIGLSANKPGADPDDHWVIDWGDGSTPAILPAATPSTTHTYATALGTASVQATFYSDTTPYNASPLTVHVTSGPVEGTLDSNFGSGGTFTTDAIQNVQGMVLQPNGMIVVAGTTPTEDGSNCVIERFKPDGTPDPTFNSGNPLVFNFNGPSSLTSLILRPTGQIVVAGTAFNGIDGTGVDGWAGALEQFLDNGTPDPSFGAGGSGIILAAPADGSFVPIDAALQSDGKVVVVGKGYGGVSILTVARFTMLGALDSDFGAGGWAATDSAFAHSDLKVAVAAAPGRKVVIAAWDSFENNDPHLILERFKEDGTPDTSFGSNGFVQTQTPAGASGLFVHGLAVAPDGSVIVAGQDSVGAQSELFLARYTSLGTLQGTFGSGGFVQIDGFAQSTMFAPFSSIGFTLSSDGKIWLAAGITGSINNQPVQGFGVFRFKSDGSADTAFGPDGRATDLPFASSNGQAATRMALDPTGGVLLAGPVGTTNTGVARLRAYDAAPLGPLEPTTVTLTTTSASHIIELNSSHDLGNTDWAGNALNDDDLVYDDNWGQDVYRIRVGDGPFDPDLVDATLHFSGAGTGTRQVAFSSSFLRVWNVTDPLNPISMLSGRNVHISVPAGGLDMPLKIEGIGISHAFNDAKVIATFMPDGGGAVSSQTLSLTVVGVAEYIDADNNNGYDDPDRSKREGAYKQDLNRSGKVLTAEYPDVGDLPDADHDGIPDFADGYNRDGIAGNDDDAIDTTASDGTAVLRFVPVLAQLVRPIDVTAATATFNYHDSNPLAVSVSGDTYTPAVDGLLRLWLNRDGSQTRDGRDVKDGGDFITADVTYTAAELGFVPGGADVVRLYVEGIKPVGYTTAEDDLRRIEMTVDPDGTGAFTQMKPARVSVTVAPAAPSDTTGFGGTASGTTATLKWTHAIDDVTAFKLERWIDGGSITTINLAYTARSYPDSGLTPGTTYRYRLTAYNGATSSNAVTTDVTIQPIGSDQPPDIDPLHPAHASQGTVTGKTVDLSVLGTDDGGEANLSYHWDVTPAGPTFSVNGTNGSKNTTATFHAAGTYTFVVTITDAGGLTHTSPAVSVTVVQTRTILRVTPASVSLPLSTPTHTQTQQFTASSLDQFQNTMDNPAALHWAYTGDGTLDPSGLYTAPESGSSAAVTVSGGGLESAAAIVTLKSGADIPNTPTGLILVQSVMGEVDIRWNPDDVPGAVTYSVYASTDEGFTPSDGTLMASDIVSPSYTENFFGDPGAIWFYKVTASNGSSESAPSAELAATVPSATSDDYVDGPDGAPAPDDMGNDPQEFALPATSTPTPLLVAFYGAGTIEGFGNKEFKEIAKDLGGTIRSDTGPYRDFQEENALHELLIKLDTKPEGKPDHIITPEEAGAVTLNVLGYSWGGPAAINFVRDLRQPANNLAGIKRTETDPAHTHGHVVYVGGYNLQAPVHVNTLVTIDPVLAAFGVSGLVRNVTGPVSGNVDKFRSYYQQRGGGTSFDIYSDFGPTGQAPHVIPVLSPDFPWFNFGTVFGGDEVSTDVTNSVQTRVDTQWANLAKRGRLWTVGDGLETLYGQLEGKNVQHDTMPLYVFYVVEGDFGLTIG